MEHDFFYGSQSESFSFCRIPRQLLTGAAYREISTDAKLLYGLCLRMLCRQTLTLLLFPGASCTAASGAART